jgi:hypothetical protein
LKSTHRPSSLIKRPDLAKVGAGYAGRIAQLIMNCDLRCSHDGLMEIARKRGISLDNLPQGHYLVFINATADRFKLLTRSSDGRGIIIAYYRSFAGRIQRDSIEDLPRAFGIGNSLQSGREVARKLDEQLAYKRARRVN